MTDPTNAAMPPEGSREDIELLLPWYVNGTLDAADVAKVEDYLARHPDMVERSPTAEPDLPLACKLFPVLHDLYGSSGAPPVAAEDDAPAELRLRAFEVLSRLFVQLTRRRPVVVFIDEPPSESLRSPAPPATPAPSWGSSPSLVQALGARRRPPAARVTRSDEIRVMRVVVP